MGLVNKLFGGGAPDFPPLDSGHYASGRVEAVRPELETLMRKTKDRLELIPAEHAAYVFIGKPPKKFGVAWIHDGKVSNFKNLVEEKGVPPTRLESLVGELKKAYEQSDAAERFTTSVGGRDVVVTPSDELERAVHHAIQTVA
ncbi:MAG: hypothetical protein WBG92_02950 [Thiohalocapsa sp.]